MPALLFAALLATPAWSEPLCSFEDAAPDAAHGALVDWERPRHVRATPTLAVTALDQPGVLYTLEVRVHGPAADVRWAQGPLDLAANASTSVPIHLPRAAVGAATLVVRLVAVDEASGAELTRVRAPLVSLARGAEGTPIALPAAPAATSADADGVALF